MSGTATPNHVTGTALEVGALRPEQSAAAAEALARAFHDDPMMAYLVPDEDRRRRMLPAYFRSVVELAGRRGSLNVATRGSKVEGALIAMPPGTYPLPVLPQLTQFRTMIASGPTAILRNFRDLPPIDARRPKVSYWYVMYLGVRPESQGKRCGATLLSHALSRADGERLPSYLVTMKQANVDYYQRFGFGVREELRMGKHGPATWTLFREPMGESSPPPVRP